MPTRSVNEWLTRMQEASRQRAYTGTLVVSAGSVMSASRIWHVCDGVQQMERIETLTGAPRTTIRRNNEVITFVPDAKTAWIEERESLGLFPDLLRTPANAIAPAPLRYVGGDGRETRVLEQAHLVLGCEGIGYRDPDYFALAIYSTLFGGGMSSRLFQTVREERGLVYSIYSFASSYAETGLFGIYAGTGLDHVAHDHVLHLVAGHSGPLQGTLDGDAPELDVSGGSQDRHASL